MDLDDSREIRVNSGQVIGLIMLLLAMLPRDIRSDLVDRLHRMTTQEIEHQPQLPLKGLETQLLILLLGEKCPSLFHQLLLENISLREKCRSLLRVKEIECSKESTCRQFLDLSF